MSEEREDFLRRALQGGEDEARPAFKVSLRQAFVRGEISPNPASQGDSDLRTEPAMAIEDGLRVPLPRPRAEYRVAAREAFLTAGEGAAEGLAPTTRRPPRPARPVRRSAAGSAARRSTRRSQPAARRPNLVVWGSLAAAAGLLLAVALQFTGSSAGPGGDAPQLAWHLLEANGAGAFQAGSPGARPTLLGAVDTLDQQLRVGLDNRVRLQLDPQTRLSLGSPGALAEAGSIAIEMTEGNLQMMTAQPLEDGTVVITTPHVVVTLVGTCIGLLSKGEGTCVCVSKGTVQVVSRHDSFEPVTVGPNQTCFVKNDGTIAYFDTLVDDEHAHQLVRFQERGI